MTDLMESAPHVVPDPVAPDPAAARAAAPSVAALAAEFALLADPLRLSIVRALAAEQLCTSHLIDVTGAKQPTISHHLRILREAGVVVGEPDGRFTWYRLAPGAFTAVTEQLHDLVPGRPTPRLRGATGE